MKRLLLSFIFFLAINLTACQSSTLSISEVKEVPNNVQEMINPNHTLQLVNEDEDAYFIVFQSKGTYTIDLETEDNKVLVKLDEVNQQDDILKQHVYKLTLAPEHDTIGVYINGNHIPFDNVIL